MKRSTAGPGAVWALAAWLIAASTAAQELVVIEGSEQDRAAADKLAELIRQPFVRLEGAALPPGDPRAFACSSGRRNVVVLDGARDAVQLWRCADDTLLSRAIDPAAARDTPWLAAFVAAELISLAGELDGAAQPPAASPAPPRASPEPHRSSRLLWLRLGVELLALGAPFAPAAWPGLALGVALTPALLLELQLNALASGELNRNAERLTLTRSDARLRAGLRSPGGPLVFAAFVHARGSIVEAEYRGPTRSSTGSLRWGVGAAAELQLELAPWAALYADLVVDLATSRSDYRVQNVTWARDPAHVISCGLGLLLRTSL